MIPKVIHQTWKTKDIPDKWKAYHESWVLHHPDWNVKVWTDEDLCNLVVQKCSPEHLKLYDGFPHNIQRIDYARTLLVEQGGFYIDLDFECYQSFDHLLSEELIIVESPYKENEQHQNSLMASTPNHPFWPYLRECMKQANESSLMNRFALTGILASTGPIVLDQALESFKLKVDPEFKYTLLPAQEYFVKGAKFACHHQANSWVNDVIITLLSYLLPPVLILVILCIYFIVIRRRRMIKTQVDPSNEKKEI